MKSALKKKYKKILEEFFKLLYGQISLNLNKKNSIEKKRSINRIFLKKKYYTYSIRKGIVFTDSTQNVAAISKNQLYQECSFQHANNKIVSAIFNPVLKNGTPKIRKKYIGTALSLVQGASGENYFHWLVDILPKIKICIQNYPIDKIDYFYLPKLLNPQRETLRHLGIKPNQIINSRSEKHISADKVIFTSHPWYTKGKFHDQSHKLPKWSIIWVKNTFLSFKKKFKSNKKIFLDRSNSKYSHCQIINNKELKIFLRSLGFKFVKPDKLSFAKQVYMFWNAKFVIGAHGAAFTNIIFCRPKTQIVELRPHGHPGRNYQRIASINKLRYRYLQSEKKYLNHDNGDIFVNTKKLKKIIN